MATLRSAPCNQRAVGFNVANPPRHANRIVAFYSQRGTAEQWIKEGQERRQMDTLVLPDHGGQSDHHAIESGPMDRPSGKCSPNQ
jgi:hypothetical protein